MQVGCGPAATTKPTEKATRQAVDPWPKLVVTLRTDSDPAACRQALAELNSGLAANPAVERPRGPKENELAKATADLTLSDAEARFLAQSDYTGADGNHLAESLFLRDVAKSLGAQPTDPPATRATAAFRWVCRQVVLNPWVVKAPNGAMEGKAPVPPAYVLRRGSGSGLERAFTFVALCRQLDLDAYLIGSDATDRPWSYRPGSDNSMFPKGPFWAVGVRADKDILLYDPWRGEFVPGKTAERPATLAEVRADPNAVGTWPGEKPAAWDVPADALRSAEVYLSVPLPALAPRMEMLNDLLRAESGVRLFVNWEAAAGKAREAGGGAAVKGWNPKVDPFTPVRVLSSFLPEGQGGQDRGTGQAPLWQMFEASTVPREKLDRLRNALRSPDAGDRLMATAAGQYATVFLKTPSPRELIQRGRHLEATKELVDVRDGFQKADDVVSGSAAATAGQLKEWFEEANRRYDALSKARISRNKEVELPVAERAVEELWKASQGTITLVISGSIAKAGAGEATYLLELSFHERAERSQLDVDRLTRSGGAEAAKTARQKAATEWASAVGWWQKYEAYRADQASSFPGRGEHAKNLGERANRMAAVK